MQCHQARQLFDAYLDGELSPSLATELGTHRLKCPDCRQALALMEVSGHILRSDRDPVVVSEDFTDRLLACVDSAPQWRRKLLHVVYYGGPLAAAAMIALAFVGVFDGRRPSQVAGVQHVLPPTTVSMEPVAKSAPAATAEPTAATEEALNQFVDETSSRIQAQGDSMQRVLDLTVLQMIDILEEAKARSLKEPFPRAVHEPVQEDEAQQVQEVESPEEFPSGANDAIENDAADSDDDPGSEEDPATSDESQQP